MPYTFEDASNRELRSLIIDASGWIRREYKRAGRQGVITGLWGGGVVFSNLYLRQWKNPEAPDLDLVGIIVPVEGWVKAGRAYDSWGNDYLCRVEWRANYTLSINIWSCGKNGINDSGGGDDIVATTFLTEEDLVR